MKVKTLEKKKAYMKKEIEGNAVKSSKLINGILKLKTKRRSGYQSAKKDEQIMLLETKLDDLA